MRVQMIECVYTCDFVIDVSEFVMKKTSSSKFNDTIRFVITVVADASAVTIYLILFCLLHAMSCFAMPCTALLGLS